MRREMQTTIEAPERSSARNPSSRRRQAPKTVHPVRIWIDITNAPHVLVLGPVIRRLLDLGHEVSVTARDFSQTLPLLEQHGIRHTVVGRHQGRRVTRKALGLLGRTVRLAAFGARNRFDLALSHGSNDLAIAAFFLRIPHVTMFDYEFARLAHNVNLRLSTKILIPDAIPSEPLHAYGGRDEKIDKYPGLKEEYYLSDFVPDPSILRGLGIDSRKIIIVMRTAPDFAMYHRFENSLFLDLLEEFSSRPEAVTVLLPRTPEQRRELEQKGYSNVLIPQGAIDAQSLIQAADLVVGGGGTMNREAVALGTPAYTLFEGKLGAIDRMLIEQGRLVKVERVDDVRLVKKTLSGAGARRDPSVLVERILATVAGAR